MNEIINLVNRYQFPVASLMSGLASGFTFVLIVPWVQVPHLASHVLGKMAKVLPVDWQRVYNHRVYFLETFVDTQRFKGTCYKAANWIYLGNTTGRGKNDQTHKPNRSIKAVWAYPLSIDFREVLQRG